MSRALTAGELSSIRSDGQHSDMFLAVWKPETVFAAQINETFTDVNGVASITYDNVTTGAYTDIKSGMTAYIGSSAGLADVGRVRVRKTPTSSILYVAERSDIAYDDDLYITVVNKYDVWYKKPRVSDSVLYMDYDLLAYTNEHSTPYPVPVMGAPLVPLWLDGASVTYEPDATDSYVPGGSVSSYSWATSGGSVANETTATPTFTFSAAGQYTITLTVANGSKTTKGVRHVIVYDDDNMPYIPDTSQVTTSQNGWQFSATLYDDDVSDIPQNALCCLFTRDYYAGTETAIGANSATANILATGWTDNETSVYDPEVKRWTLSAFSVEYWLEKATSYPVTFTNTTATDWLTIPSLTVDLAIYNLLYWQSTAMTLTDVFLTGNARTAAALDGTGNSLFQQVQAFNARILSRGVSDQYGALHNRVDVNYLPETSRSSIPVVMDITAADFQDRIDIPERTTNALAFLELSGVTSGGNYYFSRAAGDVYSAHGATQSQDNLIVSSQADANTLAGLILSRANNEFPRIRVTMASGVKVFDIAPLMYVTVSVASGDTSRGLVWASKKFIPSRLIYTHNRSSGFLQLSLELEAETLEGLGTTYERPQTPLDNFAPAFDDFNLDFALEPLGGLFGDLQTSTPQDPEIDIDNCSTDTAAEANGPFYLWASGTQYSDTTKSFYMHYPSVLRSSGHTNKSTFNILGTFETRTGSTWAEDTSDTSWYTVYGRSNSGRVATATKSAITEPKNREFVFSPTVSTGIAGVEVVLNTDTATFDSSAVTITPTETGGTQEVSHNYNSFDNGSGVKTFINAQWTVGDPVPYDPEYDIVFPFDGVSFPFGTTGYFDISWSIQVIGATTTFLDVTVPTTSSGDVTYTDEYSKTLSGWAVSTRFSAFPIVEIPMNIKFRHPKGSTPTYVIEINVSQSANHRIRYDNAILYNICPKVT